MKFILTLILAFIMTLPSYAANTILILGDSISAGYGIAPEQGWVSLLQKRIKQEKYSFNVINASISGNTTADGLERLPKLLSAHKPNIVVIELGGNDGLRGISLFAIRSNLKKIITLADNDGCDIIILGVRLPPNYGETYMKQFQQIFIDLEKDVTLRVIPEFLKGVDDDKNKMQDDGIHPNASAQPILLETVWPQLKELM